LAKKWRVLLLVSLSLMLVTGLVAGCSKPKAKTGDTVKIDYTLTMDDGTVKDSSEGKEPLEFTLGDGTLIPGFENAVIGMEVGETKNVTIPPSEGYGEYDDTLTAVIDRTQLPSDIVPTVGLQLQGTNADGSITTVTIIAVTDTTITIDGNYELAGKNLNFKITLVEIEKKTATTTSSP
jgi:peptidylprolyl isomerase